MGLKSPPFDLGQRRLRLVRVPEILVRISRAGYRDPFFWSRLGRNRFDLPDGGSGVLHAAQDLETCVLEVFAGPVVEGTSDVGSSAAKFRGSDLCRWAGVASG